MDQLAPQSACSAAWATGLMIDIDPHPIPTAHKDNLVTTVMEVLLRWHASSKVKHQDVEAFAKTLCTRGTHTVLLPLRTGPSKGPPSSVTEKEITCEAGFFATLDDAAEFASRKTTLQYQLQINFAGNCPNDRIMTVLSRTASRVLNRPVATDEVPTLFAKQSIDTKNRTAAPRMPNYFRFDVKFHRELSADDLHKFKEMCAIHKEQRSKTFMKADSPHLAVKKATFSYITEQRSGNSSAKHPIGWMHEEYCSFASSNPDIANTTASSDTGGGPVRDPKNPWQAGASAIVQQAPAQQAQSSNSSAPAALAAENCASSDAEEELHLQHLDSQQHPDAPPSKVHAVQPPPHHVTPGQLPLQQPEQQPQHQQQHRGGMADLYQMHAQMMRPHAPSTAAAASSSSRILHAVRPSQSTPRLKAIPNRPARDADDGDDDSDLEEEKLLRAKDSLAHADAPPHKTPANILSPPRSSKATHPKSPVYPARPPTPRCAVDSCGKWAVIGGLGFCTAHSTLDAIENSQSPASRVASQASTLVLSSQADSLESPHSETDLADYVELAGRAGESRLQRGIEVTGGQSSDETSETGSLPPSTQSADSSQARTYDSVGSFHPHLCRTGFSLPLCGARHEMVFGSFSQPNHKCDTCDTDIPARAWGFHCALCDSDICTTCWSIDWDPVQSFPSSLEDSSQPSVTSQAAAPGLNQDPPAPTSSGPTGRGAGALDV